MRLEIVNPASLAAPRGWSHGVLAPRDGRLLFVAGMAGFTEGQAGEPPAFVEQFTRALDQLLAVVREAGGEASDVARTGRSPEAALASVLATAGQERLITPAEVAAAALALCGPGAADTNGAAITLMPKGDVCVSRS